MLAVESCYQCSEWFFTEQCNVQCCATSYEVFVTKLISLQSQEASKKDEAEDEVDLFASDEEPAAVPVKVNPAPKQTKSKKEASKNVEIPPFPNKAECNDAEAKFHAALSQVVLRK